VITLWIPVQTDYRIVFPKNFIYPTPDAAPCPIGGAKLETDVFERFGFKYFLCYKADITKFYFKLEHKRKNGQ
jgi:hypothetical protein